MGSIAKQGLKKLMLQLQQHPLRTKMGLQLVKGVTLNPVPSLTFDFTNIFSSAKQQCVIMNWAIMAAVVSAISDIVSQKLSGIQKIQLRRLLLKVILGFAYLGPFGHFLHMQLEKIFKGKKDPKTVAKKVLVEQFTSAPLNNLLFMIYLGAVIERRPWMDVKAKIKKEYPTVMITSWAFWPVVGYINHTYMPLQLRVVFQIIVSFFWGIFLNLRARPTRLTNSAKAK